MIARARAAARLATTAAPARTLAKARVVAQFRRRRNNDPQYRVFEQAAPVLERLFHWCGTGALYGSILTRSRRSDHELYECPNFDSARRSAGFGDYRGFGV